MIITLFGKSIRIGKNKTHKMLLKAFGKQLHLFSKDQPDLFTGQEKDGKKLLPSKADPQVRRWQTDEKKDENSLKDTKNMLDINVKNSYIAGDKKRSSKMEKLFAKTPTGKGIEIVYDGEKFTVSIPEINLTQAADYLYIRSFGPPALNLNKPIALDAKSIDGVKKFLEDIEKEKTKKRDEAIPGYSELKAAYDYRSEQLDLYQSYMDRAVRTSIGSGDSGDVDGAEEKIEELEKKYPIAKAYIYWINRDPSTVSGYQANHAAKALIDGKSLEDARRIANDYDAAGL